MQIDRNLFIDALRVVSPAIDTKDLIEQSASCVFYNTHLAAFNNSFMIIADSPLKKITGAVKATELITILSKFKTDFIDVAFLDNEVVVKSGKAKAGIRFEDAVKLPIDDALVAFMKVVPVEIPDDLFLAIERAKFCVGHGFLPYIFSCVHFKDNIVSSTDKMRVFQTALKKNNSNLPEFILPSTCINALKAFNPITIAISDKWVFFQNAQDALFCVRMHNLTADPWPIDMLNKIINNKGVEIVLPSGILEALDKVEVFLKNADEAIGNFVEFSINSKHLIVKGQGANGWYKESFPSKYEGEPFTFYAHLTFLRDILSYIQTAYLGTNTISFHGEAFKYVLARPMNGN